MAFNARIHTQSAFRRVKLGFSVELDKEYVQ